MHVLNRFCDLRHFCVLYGRLLRLEAHQANDLVYCRSFSVLKLWFFLLFDFLAFGRSFYVFMIDLNYLIFDRLFDLVEHNRNLNVDIFFLRYLQLGVIAPDVKDV